MMYTKRFLSLLAVALTMPLVTLSAPHQQPFVPGSLVSSYSPSTNFAPLTANPHLETVPGSYMVVLKKGVTTNDFFSHRYLINTAQISANNFHSNDANGIRHVYDIEGRFQGYAGTFTDDVLNYIRSQPEVEYVEMDSTVQIDMIPQGDEMVWEVPYDVSLEDAIHTFDTPKIGTYDVEKGAPWGLARISHRKRLGFGDFNKYLYNHEAGEGVTAYVIDTGINIEHVEFEGRARWGKTIPNNDVDKDGNGHGTHCAGTIASRKYGVAKRANVVAVKVLGSNGSGSMSDVVAGVAWAVDDAKNLTKTYRQNPHSAEAKKHKGFVANMSLGGGKSPALNRIVNSAVDAGLHFSVAAGNENQDACNVSPAGAVNPLTVGASTLSDDRAYFSNKGKCVDIFAPGLNILSTWNTGNTSFNTISGTSMASPHIVGLLAYYLSIYGSDDFSYLNGEGQHLSISDVEDSIAARLSQFMPVPAMALDLIGKASSFFFPQSLTTTKSEIDGVLSPSALKKAMIKLATSGVIKDLDEDTVNKLAFNNVTAAAK